MEKENSDTVLPNYHIADIYQGGYSSLDSGYGPVFTGYHAPLVKTGETYGSRLGVSTDPRTANILKEVSEKIAPGEKVIELSAIDLGAPIEAIPKQHWDEIRRLSKLTGVEVTVHGPITDASGVVEGRQFDEERRKMVERKLLQALERSHQINPEGNIPVTFHTSNQLPGPVWERNEKGEIETVMMPVVNQETGQINQVRKIEHYAPSGIEKEPVQKEIYKAEDQLRIMNSNEWSTSIDQVEFNRQRAVEIMKDVHPTVIGRYLQFKTKKIKEDDLLPEEKQYIKQIRSAEAYLREAKKSADGLFDRGYKYGDDREKEILKAFAERYSKTLGIKGEEVDPTKYFNPLAQSEAIYELTQGLNHIQPKLFVKSEEYALEKTAKSYGNVAFEAYKKFGYGKEKDTTPLVLIENPPAGGGLSRAEDLKNVVEKSREKFVEQAAKSKEQGGLGMSKSDAEKRSKELIGVTWDVGHINQLRKFGFTGKDIIKEAETIAPLVRHVHLSDNFGLDNVELPMGMGNVDFKEVMQKLGKQGEEARKIVEAAHWWQFQQTSPMGVSMEALGSPIYGMKQGPYWNQSSGFQQGYFGGYGAFLPQINYETFGGGFSNLPTELGGQRGGGGQAGGRGRMSGTPME
ncbi:sugar phosphate isomerase/epimerase [Candidatus Pacearchaeota archaeon]|nr:sugar phosphate isomerase/epimerase [Candidatus Pacearchaeota archaeon]